MAVGLESALGDWPSPQRRDGWVNIPADCLRPMAWVKLHPARPPGINAPTAATIAGTEQVLRLVQSLTASDLCLVLLSGGGSALLALPIAGVSLADKLVVTRLLSERGATIEELNCVRRALSQVKGGGLLRACRADAVIGLVISDVIGDPLETIASGPLTPNPTSPEEALRVLRSWVALESEVPANVWSALRKPHSGGGETTERLVPHVEQHIIGNNRSACEAAAVAARELGYDVIAVRPEERGIAREVGAALARECQQLRRTRTSDRRVCLITGGEPVVHVVSTDQPRRGGRNQELVLAALQECWDEGMEGIAILSGGTDGEDGPTDAAGGIVDADVWRRALATHLDPADYLRINNSYPFLEAVGALLRTGPTHTNVMDLRVALVGTDTQTS